jgi:hypothetical protein
MSGACKPHNLLATASVLPAGGALVQVVLPDAPCRRLFPGEFQHA